MKHDKKKLQLGMNPSTASGRLIKDILWKLVQDTGQDICIKCGEKMSRDTFSIEHIVPWLDSDAPIDLFFSLDNIAFSHLSCNVKDSRGNQKYYSEEERRQGKRKLERETRKYSPEKRREQYLRTGK